MNFVVVFHALTTLNNLFIYQTDVPGPPTHQAIISKPIHFDEAFKSFNVGATRFPAISKVNLGTKLIDKVHIKTNITFLYNITTVKMTNVRNSFYVSGS